MKQDKTFWGELRFDLISMDIVLNLTCLPTQLFLKSEDFLFRILLLTEKECSLYV